MRWRIIMKKMRNGFSMVELLFVMVIMTGLAAIAIPALKSGTKSEVATSIKSDLRNSIDFMNAVIVNNGGHLPDSIPNDGDSVELLNGDTFDGNIVSITDTNKLTIINDEDLGEGCYIVRVRDIAEELGAKSYISCVDSSI
jgi:prepilin-type N-terminal cleavage/methylation domain-containing protein